MQIEAAPWTRPSVDATRRQAVMSQLPVAVKQRVEKPVAEKETVDFLAARAAAFRVGRTAAPVVLDRSAVVDLGAEAAGEARFAAAVDLDKSPALLASVKQGTGADPATAHVVAILASHVVPSRAGPVYRTRSS